MRSERSDCGEGRMREREHVLFSTCFAKGQCDQLYVLWPDRALPTVNVINCIFCMAWLGPISAFPSIKSTCEERR